MSIEDKIKLIDGIVENHPSYGVDFGYSWYVGGMKDDGDWYYRKMLDATEEELLAVVEYIAADKRRSDEKRIEEDKRVAALSDEEREWEKKMVPFGNGWATNKGIADMEMYVRERELRLLFGALGF